MENTPPQASVSPQTLLSWDAPSLPAHERTKRWYIVGGTVVIAGAAYGIVTGSWSFTIVVVLCAAVYALLHNHQPGLKHIEISDQGVTFEGVFTRFEDMTGFWLLATPAYTELHLVLKARKPNIIIQTENLPLADIRATLGNHLQELSDKKEKFFDMLIRICKL